MMRLAVVIASGDEDVNVATIGLPSEEGDGQKRFETVFNHSFSPPITSHNLNE